MKLAEHRKHLPRIGLVLVLLSPNVRSTKLSAQHIDNSFDKNVSFLVFGDMPYRAVATVDYPARTFESDLLRHVFPQLVLPDKHAFLVHVGDVKAGVEVCSEELITNNLKLISRIFPGRTIYLPGDNEWVDCDDTTDRSELDWLRFVMSQMDIFRLDIETRARLQYTTPELKRGHGGENSHWSLGGIEFIALNVPGTNMGRSNIQHADPIEIFRRADERDRHNKDYLATIFQRATSLHAKALVVFLHADIVKHPQQNRNVACQINNRQACDGFVPIRNQLLKLAGDFARPVLLVHGDTGGYCLDQPFEGDDLRNLWRLNTPGDFRVADIAEVTIDVEDSRQPFKVQGRLMQIPAPDSCQR